MAIEQVKQDLKDAMRARDQKKIDALRLITAAIKQIEVDERIQVDAQRFLVILDKLAKQRKESIALFAEASRLDLIAQEQYELDLINHYLPEPLSEQAIADLVNQVITKTEAQKQSDMGKVMAELKPLIQGRADMTAVSALVKARLS